MKDESYKRFQNYVDNIHFGDESYSIEPFENEDGEIEDNPLENYAGWMYVTIGDDKPWLVIYGPNNFGISLEPELALYWLDEILKYYKKKNSEL